MKPLNTPAPPKQRSKAILHLWWLRNHSGGEEIPTATLFNIPAQPVQKAWGLENAGGPFYIRLFGVSWSDPQAISLNGTNVLQSLSLGLAKSVPVYICVSCLNCWSGDQHKSVNFPMRGAAELHHPASGPCWFWAIIYWAETLTFLL